MRRLFTSLLVLFAALIVAARAEAFPQAHILRIDPRAGVESGAPVLTSVVEVVQFNRVSEVLQPCASETGYNQTLDCWSAQMEKKRALWMPFNFPEQNAHLLVKVNGEDRPASIAGPVVKWGESQNQPGVGTAWLVALDASSGMGSRFTDARIVAQQFIASMRPNDLMDLMIFDDRPRQLVADSKWKTFAQRNDLIAILNRVQSNSPSHGRDRPLFSQIKQMTVDAFSDLGNAQGPQALPMHQAMIVLSNGSGRGDPASASPSAEIFSEYLNNGRFPENNTSLPKTPLPVVSIWFPATGGIANSLYKTNDALFMQSLANVKIGGFFDIVRAGQGAAKAQNIIRIVRDRFDSMYIVKWRLSCLNPTVEQSFNLVFVNTKPQIAPDATFKDVPIGVDPSQWPLDVDVEKTAAAAKSDPLYPGGTFKVFGNFCWAGEKERAEAYFVPEGTKPDPNANSHDPNLARQAMQHLIAQNMRGGAKESGDAFVEFDIPDDDKLLHGSGDNMVARVVIYDNKAKRSSGHTEDSVLTLPAKEKPFNVLLIVGIGGAVIVVLLLVIVLMRSGGGRGGRGSKAAGTPPPQPVVAGGGYPPGGYGGPPPGGGYGGGAPPGGYGGGAPPGGYGGGAPPGGYGGHGGPPPGGHYAQSADHPSPARAAPAASPPVQVIVHDPAPAMPNASPPVGAPIPPPEIARVGPTPQARGAELPFEKAPAQPPAVAQVRCPACGAQTMVTPGRGSVCFSCGQPLPADVASKGGALDVPTYPLTGGHAAHPVPPPNPYEAEVVAFLLSGDAGEFRVDAGRELAVGRDPARCGFILSEPRVSAHHATLKLEAGKLFVMDAGSNNGTYVNGERIAAGGWRPVPNGAYIRFGPCAFGARASRRGED